MKAQPVPDDAAYAAAWAMYRRADYTQLLLWITYVPAEFFAYVVVRPATSEFIAGCMALVVFGAFAFAIERSNQRTLLFCCPRCGAEAGFYRRARHCLDCGLPKYAPCNPDQKPAEHAWPPAPKP